MINSTPGPMTAEEFFNYPDHRCHDLVRGALRVSEPPGGRHGRIATRIASRLEAHVERHALGSVLVEAGYVLRRDPDTVRGPDVSFVSAARLPPERIPVQFIPCAPDLAVEILSPDLRQSEVEDRLADYLTNGVRMVWLIDPDQRSVGIHYPGRSPRTVTQAEFLDGEDVVPGFSCPVAAIFGA